MCLSDEERGIAYPVFWRIMNVTRIETIKIFGESIVEKVRREKVPSFFSSLCETIKRTEKKDGKYNHLIRNLPIDQNLPMLDSDDPVNDKYLRKKTFLGESLLELVSHLLNLPLLAYQTRNNGDFFHDVYPVSKYRNTQTQKTDSDLYFHNDRTAHIVRPDYLILLGLRCYEGNRIYTGYVDGKDIIKRLSKKDQDSLRKGYYETPFDAYSQDSNKVQVKSEVHPVLKNQHSFRYYDTRTRIVEQAPPEAYYSLIALKNAITTAPKRQSPT